MTNDPTGWRQARIEKLLDELRYELARGMQERDIDEELTLRWIVPVSSTIKDGVVLCSFETRPVPHYTVDPRLGLKPFLRLIK